MFGNSELRENVLVTSGDLGVFTKDADVWSLTNGKAVCNVPEGQLVIMNTKTGVGVDATNIASVTDPIRIGVSKGDTIRWLGGEEFFTNSVSAMSAMYPVCGSPEVVDLWWNCTECYKDYAVLLRVRDNDTMSYTSAPTDSEPYIANARPDCNSCPPDCSPEATCASIAPELVSQLQTVLDEQDIKAYATQIYDYTKVYCFKSDHWTCGTGCVDMDVSGDAEVVSNSTVIDIVTGVPYATPSTMTELLATLEHIKTTLEASSDFTGTVWYTKGFGDNCCVQLWVNTDNADFAIEDSAGSAITACDTIDDATDHPNMCGIRVIAAPVTQDSGCLITKNLAYYGRHIDLYAMSDSFEDAVVEKTQSMTLPQNFGNFVQFEEYKQEVGGQGRTYRGTNTALMDGFNGVNQDSLSRVMNAMTVTDVTKYYVSYHIHHKHPHYEHGNLGWSNAASALGSIYVPDCDSTTITAVEAILNAIGPVSGLPGAISGASGDHPSIEGSNLG